jgi:hypothetical protein
MYSNPATPEKVKPLRPKMTPQQCADAIQQMDTEDEKRRRLARRIP